jgi:uncharacterized protein (DUF488 family)
VIVETLCTIGYEGAAVESFVAALKRAGVTTLLDVRAVAMSRRRTFCKEALRQSLDAAGIVYRHLSALGTPTAGREAAKKGARATFEAILAAQLDSPAGRHALDEAVLLAQREQVALMCLERDPARCHRTIVAARIVRRTGQRVEALYADPLL